MAAPVALGSGSDSLIEQAYQAIRSMILDLSLPPGASVSIPELAGRLGMSRTPVNQAIARLKSEGLVVTQPRRGMSVRVLTVADLQEIYQVVAALEGQAAYLAALRAGEVQLEQLEETLERQEIALAADDLAGWQAADGDFHRSLALASGNQRLVDVLRLMDGQLRPVGSAALLWRPKPTVSTADHRAVLAAIKARDPQAARQLHLAHRERVLEMMEAAFVQVLALVQSASWSVAPAERKQPAEGGVLSKNNS